MLRLTVDGQPVTVPDGVTTLQALRSAGRAVPSLCHDDRLIPSGACRLCLVRDEGSRRLVAACTTPAIDGMSIVTNDPEIESLRRGVLELLAESYPAEAASRFPDKVFHRYLRDFGVHARGTADPTLLDAAHPHIQVDMSQCVHCYRCVRICDELQGQSVWRVWHRGDQTRIVPDSGSSLLSSTCVSCGACVDTCPTGALEDRARLTGETPSTWTRTVCPYCGTGCELSVGVRDGRIVAAEPVLDAPVSRGHLCVKGRYAYAFESAGDRVLEPMVREAGGWRTVSWEEAIGTVATRLATLIQRDGADAVGVLGSARGTNEDAYLAQKFARVVVGTNNVDCCARVCHTPSAAALKLMLGAGAATNSFDDIERARTLLVCGANPTENHPIVGARIKQAARAGARLIVIDPRRIELADYADYYLAPRPGTNVPLLNAIAHTIMTERLYDAAFIADRVSGLEDFGAFIQEWTPERAAELCGVSAEAIRGAARLYATHRPSMSVHGLGVTEHTQGTESVMCLVNLALLTGSLGRPGAGVNPLRGQNNVQGAAHMGCDPGVLPGGASINEARGDFEEAWKVPLPRGRGLHLLEMMDAAVAGDLKALYVIGYDIAMTNADANRTAEALKRLELVVVQDLFVNETARRFGTVFLPAASPFERDGTYMNGERRIQRVRACHPPYGSVWPDWEIMCVLARRMGHGHHFGFDSAEDVWNEIRAVWPAGRGITYNRLDRGGIQWPCSLEDHPGTAVLHVDAFTLGQRAELRRVKYRATTEQVTPDYPFVLTTGRTLYHFNSGTMTYRTGNALLRPGDLLDMSPTDADRLALRTGDRVRVVSEYGEAVLPLHVDPKIKGGELFATFHVAASRLNAVTGPHRDRYVGAPEYKVTAVRVEPV